MNGPEVAGISRPYAFLVGGVSSEIERSAPSGWERDHGDPDALRTGWSVGSGSVNRRTVLGGEPVGRAKAHRRANGLDPADLGWPRVVEAMISRCPREPRPVVKG